MEVKSGRKYYLKLSGYKKRLFHIDYILENPTDRKISGSLIILRTWNRFKRQWIHISIPYWELAIFNDWNYEKLDNLNNTK